MTEKLKNGAFQTESIANQDEVTLLQQAAEAFGGNATILLTNTTQEKLPHHDSETNYDSFVLPGQSVINILTPGLKPGEGQQFWQKYQELKAAAQQSAETGK